MTAPSPSQRRRGPTAICLPPVLLTILASAAPAQSTGFHGGPTHAASYTSSDGEFGGLRWRVQTDAPVRSSPAIVGGFVYVGSSDGRLYAIDAASGEVRWRVEVGSPVTSSPAVGSRLVVVGGRDGRFHAFTTDAGTPRWTVATGPDAPLPWGHESGDVWTSSPTIVGTRAYLAGGDGVLRAVELATGREIWRARAGGRLRASPAADGSLVVVGSTDGHVYAFAAEDGRPRWRFATDGAALESARFGFDRRTVQSSPTIDGRAVYVGARDGFLYAIDRETGRERWRFDHQVSWCNTTPALSDGVVYAGSSDGLFVQAVDAETGRERWRARTAGIVWGSPAVTGGTVYAPDGTGRLYALDRQTGAVRWVWRAGARIFSSPALGDGTLYLGSDDGGIYALDVAARRPLERVVFWDSTLVGDATYGPHAALRAYLAGRGFTVVNAADLARWLATRPLEDGRSAVVFAVDHLPADLAGPGGDAAARLRAYLERGGTVVWPGAAPLLWPRDPATGRRTLAGVDRAAATRLLGVGFARANFDPVGIVAVAPLGRAFGIVPGSLVPWGADAGSVEHVLATDELGQAAAYAAAVGRGWFVRIPVADAGDGGAVNATAVKAAADHIWR